MTFPPTRDQSHHDSKSGRIKDSYKIEKTFFFFHFHRHATSRRLLFVRASFDASFQFPLLSHVNSHKLSLRGKTAAFLYSFPFFFFFFFFSFQFRLQFLLEDPAFLWTKAIENLKGTSRRGICTITPLKNWTIERNVLAKFSSSHFFYFSA